jgi:hypothetical protein
MASYTNTWNSRQDLFRTMPLRSFLVFCLAVGCTFAAIRVVNDLFDLEHSDSKHLLAKVLTTFSFAVLWVLFVHRRMPKVVLAFLAAAQILWLLASARLFPPVEHVLTPQDWKTHVANPRLSADRPYFVQLRMVRHVSLNGGKRYFAAHTGIELASRIQRQLVPPIALTTENLEIYGLSIPSGTVGGDLIDAIEENGVVCACVADVAGHGVAAGVFDEYGENRHANAFHHKPTRHQRIFGSPEAGHAAQLLRCGSCADIPLPVGRTAPSPGVSSKISRSQCFQVANTKPLKSISNPAISSPSSPTG